MADAVKFSFVRRHAGVFAAIVMLAIYGLEAHARRHFQPTPAIQGDQDAYLADSVQMYQTKYAAPGERARMPALPFLLSFIYRPGLTEQEFLERAQAFNVNLSIVLLAVLFAIFRRKFATIYALALLAATAFGVFLYRSVMVQPEVLLYTLAFGLFFLFARLLTAPRWWLALLAGATLGVAHLTKASLLPALALWVVLFAVQTVWIRNFGPRFVVLLLVIGAFFAVTFPYLRTSKEMYGQYFYNVNSGFVMWCDSWPEALGWLEVHIDQKKWRALPAEQIPSPAKYWREHSVRDIAQRLGRGFRSLATQKAMGLGYYKFVVAVVLASAAAWLVWPRRAREAIAQNPFGAAWAFLFCAMFVVLIAWFDTITSDTRFILMIFLPVVFSASTFLLSVGGDHTFSVAGRRLPLVTAFSGVLLCLSFMDVLYNAWRNFGS
jgi:hypothetical protein